MSTRSMHKHVRTYESHEYHVFQLQKKKKKEARCRFTQKYRFAHKTLQLGPGFNPFNRITYFLFCHRFLSTVYDSAASASSNI